MRGKSERVEIYPLESINRTGQRSFEPASPLLCVTAVSFATLVENSLFSGGFRLRMSIVGPPGHCSRFTLGD